MPIIINAVIFIIKTTNNIMEHHRYLILIVLILLSFCHNIMSNDNGDETDPETSTPIDETMNICEIPCNKERFDIGKDCVDAGNKCQCVAHCCWAFDCRLWPVFAQCRKKCKVKDWSRFGQMKGPVDCDHYRCYQHYLIPWDTRNVNNSKHVNCIQHCCYALNCKKFSGYCREMCIPRTEIIYIAKDSIVSNTEDP